MDNGSSYTKRLTDFLICDNVKFHIQTPTSLCLDSLPGYDRIILSGRKHNEKNTNKVNSAVVQQHILNNTEPKLLGICYGAEILALTLGGTIKRVKPNKSKNMIHITIPNPLVDVGSMMVFESHGYEISRLPEPMVGIAHSDMCKYEIIRYGTSKIFGTQFHPEISGESGQQLLKRFCSL